MSDSSQRTVVSAPGKVLIAGGYLVLDPTYSGVVVSTSSRFFTVVESGKFGGQNQINVRSPQFRNTAWTYRVRFDNDETVSVDSTSSASSNKFVHIALQNAFLLAAEVKALEELRASLLSGLDISIVGDNDFYSQRSQLDRRGFPRTLDGLSRLPPFCPTGVAIDEVEKTGLGSSAALITSLVSSLLLHLSVIDSLDDDESRKLVHNTAQFVHCLAQGKVGSGFDVSAAVFGSQLYTRFDPSVIQELMHAENTSKKQFLLPVLSPDNMAWDNKALPFRFPPCTRLMLADVGAGSNTPSLVGKVLKWRKEHPDRALALWTSLDEANQTLAQALSSLAESHAADSKAYVNAVKQVSSVQLVGDASAIFVDQFRQLKSVSTIVRNKMREMGNLAGVPIEPPEQSQLLDASAAIDGVIAGGVPGAGGYDAIWLLVCEPSPSELDALSPMERVQQLWSTWPGLSMAPLSSVESLGPGVRVERLEAIPGLKEVIGL